MRSALAVLAMVVIQAVLLACNTPELEPQTDTCLSGTNCGGTCVQLATDGANCGSCGITCAAGQVCSGGKCTVTCAAPLATCGADLTARCVDLRSDPTSCGSCDRACGDGQLCAGGACVETCDAPLSSCSDETSSTCADLRFDPRNCGTCNNACAEGSVCSAGECRPGCSAPLTACGTDDDGVCADLRNDPDHCGECGNACPQDQVCVAGSCTASCAAPLAVCGTGDEARCVDPRTDVDNCGECGNACDAGQACLAGMCTATCEGAGGALCDGTCVDLTTDNANCGECGNACPGGTACQDGTCALTCPGDEIPCGESCLDPSADPQNCGACGNVCSTGLCRAGDCAAPACTATLGLPARPQATPNPNSGQALEHAFIDLDGDGVLDLALPRSSAGSVEISRVQAPGVFAAPIYIPVAGTPTGIAAGDVDGDGRTDLVACSSAGTGAISLLRNRGDGTFARSDFPANDAVSQCALGDLDGDGRPDLVLTYNRSARIAVARNTGGAFALPVALPSGKPFPRNVALADLNRDGKLDVVVINAPFSTNAGDPEIDRGSVSVYLGAGDGTLGAPTTYASGGLALDLVVAELDGDSWPDVALAGFNGQAALIFRNDGAGGLLPRTSVAVGDNAISLIAGDLDGDGVIDLLVNRSYDDVAVLRNRGSADFDEPEIFAIRTEELALADANGDGALDVYSASWWPQLVLQEQGRLVTPTSIPVAASDELVVLTDLDRDGHLDAVLASGWANAVLILRGRADGGFAPPVSIPATGANQLAVGDLDGDGDDDLVYSGQSVFWRPNLGDATFGPEQLIFAQLNAFNSGLQLGDLDGDGDLDFAITYGLRSPGTVQIFWNDGEGTFQLGLQLVTGWDARKAAIGSIVGDDRPDLVVPNWMDGTVSVFRGLPNQGFTLHATLPVPAFSKSVLIADVTQDGRMDLVVAGPGPLESTASTIRIYPGRDQGLGAPIDLSSGPFTYPAALAATDLDSDGLRDLVVIGGAKISWRRALPGGGFAAPIQYASVQAGSAAIGDLNGDLRPDIVTIGDGGLSAHFNRCLSQ